MLSAVPPARRVRPQPAPAPAKEESKEDDDFDLFGSDDEEDAEKKKVVEERLKAYAEKKAKKVGQFQRRNDIFFNPQS